jgi:hypothetical protein
MAVGAVPLKLAQRSKALRWTLEELEGWAREAIHHLGVIRSRAANLRPSTPPAHRTVLSPVPQEGREAEFDELAHSLNAVHQIREIADHGLVEDLRGAPSSIATSVREIHEHVCRVDRAAFDEGHFTRDRTRLRAWLSSFLAEAIDPVGIDRGTWFINLLDHASERIDPDGMATRFESSIATEARQSDAPQPIAQTPAFRSAADWARHFDVPVTALRKRLERWREHNPGNGKEWIEVEGRSRRGPGYLYTAAVAQRCAEALRAAEESRRARRAGHQCPPASIECPSRKSLLR